MGSCSLTSSLQEVDISSERSECLEDQGVFEPEISLNIRPTELGLTKMRAPSPESSASFYRSFVRNSWLERRSGRDLMGQEYQ
jgi:hypothetical protein